MNMTPLLWKDIEHFRPDSKSDIWGNPYVLDVDLIYTLDAFRKFVKKPVHVHCAYEDRVGWHGKGHAVDCHVEGLHVVDQYLAAERFDEFNGIGVYPWWKSPGLHLDTRPKELKYEIDARWGSMAAGVYVMLNVEFIKRFCL